MDDVSKQTIVKESNIVSCNSNSQDVENCEYSNCSSSKRLALERIPSFSSSSNTDEEEEVEKLSNVSNEESEKSAGEYLYEEEVEETEEEEIEEIKDLSEYEFNKVEHHCNIFNDNNNENCQQSTELVNISNNANETTNKDTEYTFYETKYDDDDDDDHHEGVVDDDYSNTLITNTQKSISSSQQQPQQQGQGLETIIIMDYDDTILASSWLAQNGMDLYTPDDVVAEFAEELRLIEAAASKLLTKAIELGDVHLITNAEEGWIELTVEKFIPGIRPLLQHVSIVSARTSFERYHPTCPRSWKVLAFRQQISSYVAELTEPSSLLSQSSKQQLCIKEEGDSVTSTVAELTVIGKSDDDDNTAVVVNADGGKTSEKPSESLLKQKKINLISLGDSQHEREALQIVATEFPNSYAKTIKFVERPDIAKLQKQMELMHICMDYICEYEGNLDLMLSQIIDKDINHIDNENSTMGAI